MYKFKRAFIVGFASVILFMVSGCGGAKIELSFEKESYEVTVVKELELIPTVKNADEKDYALKFSSEDEDIATYVDGVVKGVGVGQVRLESNWKITRKSLPRRSSRLSRRRSLRSPLIPPAGARSTPSRSSRARN